MPPKAPVKPDDIIDALLDERVGEALARALGPFLKKSIDEALQEKFAEFNRTLHALKKDNVALHVQVDELRIENTDLRRQVVEQNVRVEAIETYSRIDNLIIKGLPDQSFAERGTPAATNADSVSLVAGHTSVLNTVLAFCSDVLRVDVSPHDVSSVHRLKAGPKDVVRPVVIRFSNRRVRDAVYHAKKILKNHTPSIYISEHLTKSASDLFYASRKLVREKKIYSTWTQSGLIYVKKTSDISSKPTVIKNLVDLRQYGG